MTGRPYPLKELAGVVPLATLILAIVGAAPFEAVVLVSVALVGAVAILSERARLAQLDELVAFKPRHISKVRPPDVGIAPSPIARQEYPDLPFPPYVSRQPEDGEIQNRLLELRGVTVSGERHAGKTQSLFHAVSKLSRTKIVVPRRPTESRNPLAELLKAPWVMAPWLVARLRSYVLFVDRLDEYLEGISRQDIDRWLERRPKAVFVATIPQSRCDELLDPGKDGYEHNRQILGDGSLVELTEVLEGASLKQAEELYGERPEVARLGAYLAGADAIERRFARAKRAQPLAHAIVTAAIKAAQAGLTRPLARSELRTLAQRLEPALAGSPEDSWEPAFDYCVEEPPGVTAMLLPQEADDGELSLRPNSILVDALAREGGVANGAAALPPALWTTIAVSLTQSTDDLIDIADTAASSLAETRWPHEVRDLALAFSRFAEHDPDRTVAEAAMKVRTGMHRSADPKDLADTYDRSLQGPPPPPMDPSESQVEYANRRSRSVREEGATPFDPVLPPVRKPPRIYRNRGLRDALRVTVLGACDILGLLGGIGLGAVVQASLSGSIEEIDSLLKGAVIAMPLVIVLFAYFGLYRSDGERARLGEIVKGMSITALVLALAAAALKPEASVLALVGAAAVAGSTLAFMLRWGYDQVSRRWVVRHGLQARTLLVCPAEGAAQTAHLLLRASRRPTQFIGFASTALSDHRAQLGTLDQFDDIVDEFYVQRVILADHGIEPAGRSDLAARCHARGIPMEIVPSADELLQGAAEALVDPVVPLIELPPLYLSPVSSLVKRTIDLVSAVLLSVILLPLIALLFLLSFALVPGRWPIEWSPRLGKGTMPFAMYRLRLAQDRRVSAALRAWLQRYRLDELPQLINVLRGEMSLVGPRPLTADEFAGLDRSQRRRYAVKPGLTGLWQISRGSEPTMSEMTALDLTYCRRWSPLLDFTILLRTVPAIVFSPP